MSTHNTPLGRSWTRLPKVDPLKSGSHERGWTGVSLLFFFRYGTFNLHNLAYNPYSYVHDVHATQARDLEVGSFTTELLVIAVAARPLLLDW